ncbi:MAG: BMP family ABC transporter substrate-binding protein [Lachnospiraceae bacterium]|nr:BMP family ABC transporter substrate-binding protein [Lachnospiraceae bacterium]
MSQSEDKEMMQKQYCREDGLNQQGATREVKKQCFNRDGGRKTAAFFVLKSSRRTICLLCLLSSILLSACSNGGDQYTLIKEWPADSMYANDSDIEEQSSKGGNKIEKVGMVTDVGGINDESFNQASWEGLKALTKETGVVTGYEESKDETDYIKNFQKLIDSGCTMCWGVGYNMADSLLKIAKDHPEISFGIVDNTYEIMEDNITCVTFRAQEPSFLVGYIAAAVTVTSRMGFVGGVRGEIIDQFEYGFLSGVAYANKVLGKNVTVVSEYADSFADPDKGKEIALKMYASGCDIIYHASGATGLGVIKAADQCETFVIGVDRDQSYLATDNVLTSALKNVDIAINKVSQEYLRGKDIGGQTISFGLAEGGVGIPVTHFNYPDEVYDDALEVADEIKAGKIVPPASEEAYGLFLKESKAGDPRRDMKAQESVSGNQAEAGRESVSGN